MQLTDRTVLSTGRYLSIGLLAGVIAGTTVELFLFATHAASWPGTYQWVASALAGAAAYRSEGYAWLGLALHAMVSMFWGVLYALIAQRSAALRKSPMLAGLIYGLIVFAAMQGATMAAHIWTAPTPAQLSLYLIDHAVFFGLPVALVVSRSMSRISL